MCATNRRDFLKQTGAVLSLGALPPLVAHAATGWQTMAPDAAGFKPGLADRFDSLQAGGKLAGVHGVVALRGGRIVFERYMKGTDFSWGESLGEVTFGPDTLHDVRSVTKSIVGLLYGIALANGQVPAVDQPLIAQFPEYPDLAADPQLSRLTIRHALTMTLGMQWDEKLPYTDPANGEIGMESASDRYRYILTRPVQGDPGKGWIYSGGDVALIGKIIEKGTGKTLPDFAAQALFAPLDIHSKEWAKGQDGEASAASGLRLTPRELARIGQMILADGRWNGKTVVPAEWLRESFQPAALVDIGWQGLHYGYLWYVGEAELNGKAGSYGERFVAAIGNGGQRLFVFPGLDFVLCVTAGNYNSPDQWRASSAILFNAFLPSLTT
ncbi:serine hydrolase [Paraburkholderia fungorum]|uniref:serine hydrolase domain-containing protein n=1 Tax=Paraburkholderia fungorum TaxID=134537 RepID=UPI0038B74436